MDYNFLIEEEETSRTEKVVDAAKKVIQSIITFIQKVVTTVMSKTGVMIKLTNKNLNELKKIDSSIVDDIYLPFVDKARYYALPTIETVQASIVKGVSQLIYALKSKVEDENLRAIEEMKKASAPLRKIDMQKMDSEGAKEINLYNLLQFRQEFLKEMKGYLTVSKDNRAALSIMKTDFTIHGSTRKLVNEVQSSYNLISRAFIAFERDILVMSGQFLRAAKAEEDSK